MSKGQINHKNLLSCHCHCRGITNYLCGLFLHVQVCDHWWYLSSRLITYSSWALNRVATVCLNSLHAEIIYTFQLGNAEIT